MNQFQHQEQQIQQDMQIGSGLTRYRSAPSSYFDSFLNGDDDLEQLLNPRICSPETQRIFARFMNSGDNIQENCSQNMNLQSQLNSQFLAPKKNDDDDEREVKKPRQQLQRQQSHDFSSVSQPMNRSQNAANSNIKSSVDGLFGSIDANRGAQVKMESHHSLVRHSSSPAGLFDSINIEGFPLNQWDDSILSNDFFKELEEDDAKPFPKTNASVDQRNEGGNRTTTRLTHHLSFPKSCSAVENLLQDSVPCKLRAKRGFATHPRSIAERVRRTKISERIRKLQELVPNMDKQTNTADMLDLAVDYIKDLQRQVKKLSDNGAKCGCSAMKKS